MSKERERYETVYRFLGSTIRRLRKQVPLTQKGLAEAIGAARPTVANIELGKQRVSLELLYAIGRVLKFEPRELLPKVEDLEVPGIVPPTLAATLKPRERAWLEHVTAFEAPEGNEDEVSEKKIRQAKSRDRTVASRR